MTFNNTDNDKTYTINDLYKEWKMFREADPLNHAKTFTVEYHEILMSIVNGRNDLKTSCLTVKETCDLIMTLRKKIGQNPLR